MEEIKLTPKQEKFCHVYIETGNASEAYRQAYNAENMQQDSIKVNACKLLKKTNIKLTVDRLKAEHRRRHEVTVDSLTSEIVEAQDMARRKELPDTLMKGSMNKAKLHGLAADKIEGDFTVKQIGAKEAARKILAGLALIETDLHVEEKEI